MLLSEEGENEGGVLNGGIYSFLCRPSQLWSWIHSADAVRTLWFTGTALNGCE